MSHFRKFIALAIPLIVTPLYVTHAQLVELHKTSVDETEVIVVPNRDLSTSIDHDIGALRMEISTDDRYRTYRVILDQSSYVAYADLSGPIKHFVFDPTQRRFRTLTSSLIVKLHDDDTLEDITAEYDVAWARTYPALGFALIRLAPGTNPITTTEELRLDPRIEDVQVTFTDQFRSYVNGIDPTNLAAPLTDQVPGNKDSSNSLLIARPKLDYTKPDPTFTVSVSNIGGAASSPSTLQTDLVAVVPDESTDAPNDVSLSFRMTEYADILPIDPKGEPFDVTVTFDREQLDANQTYILVFFIFDGSYPDIGETARTRSQSGFTLDAVKRIQFTCVAPDRDLMPSGTDPLLAHQWHITNTGQAAFSNEGGVSGEDLRMEETLSNALIGNGVKVAVVDTGLELCHPDLWANVEQGKSFNFNAALVEETEVNPWLIRQESTDPFNFNPTTAHGTSVAGLIAATADNSIGGRGVAPGVQLRGYNMLNASDLIQALIASVGASDYQPDSTDVDVFNMSFVKFGERPSKLAVFGEQVFLNGVQKLRSGNGAIYVKSGGNAFSGCYSLRRDINDEIGCTSTHLDEIQSLPYLIVVGAHNAAGRKSSYSSAGANLWISAPGGEDGAYHPALVTTDATGFERGRATLLEAFGWYFRLEHDDELNPHGDYTSLMSGTSSAAPNTAGAVAILLEVNPLFTWRDVKHILANTARKIDAGIESVELTISENSRVIQLPWTENAAGYSFHNWYGFGAVAVDDAVEFAEEYEPNSLGDFYESAWFEHNETVDIPDNDVSGVSQTLNVRGLLADASIEAAVVEVDWQHDFPNDLGVHLISPEGTRSVIGQVFDEALAVKDMGTFTWRMLTNAFYGENPNGEWRLEVFDGDIDDIGQLFSWRLRIYYGEHP